MRFAPSVASGDVLEVRCLNRIFRWVPATSQSQEAIELEADPRHQQIIKKQLGLMKVSKGVVTPGIKPTSPELGESLTGTAATLFRSLTMRGSYLAEDRPEMRFAVREIARLMSSPCEAGMTWLKRVGRFLVDQFGVVQTFKRQESVGYFNASCPMYPNSPIDYLCCTLLWFTPD